MLLLHGLGHRILYVHFNAATEWIPLQHLLLMLLLIELRVVLLEGRYGDRLGLVKLLVGLYFCLFLLHLDLLLNSSDLISYAHGVILNLFAHLEGPARRFGVSRLDHLAHRYLLLRQVHHLEVLSDLELIPTDAVL